MPSVQRAFCRYAVRKVLGKYSRTPSGMRMLDTFSRPRPNQARRRVTYSTWNFPKICFMPRCASRAPMS
ncbi:hypothetical protein D3C71_1842660 [compost metagenome]